MSGSLSTYWRGMASGRDRGPSARLLWFLLLVPSLLYGLVQRVRAGLFAAGILKVHRLPRPVISVGNITVGGTGKTPVTAMIAGMLLEQGLRVAVLSRGYGGSSEGEVKVVSDGCEIFLKAREIGDEPYLLASTIPGLMVIIGADRYAAGMLAMERLHPDVFLLDDGFQHLRLYRDMNVLLLDYARPFGNGFCLPAGLLREQARAVGRADLVVHTRCPAEIVAKAIVSDRPNCYARHVLKDLVPINGGDTLCFDDLSGRKVLACAGIADPEAFFHDLRSRGLNLVSTICFPDHAEYSDADIAELAGSFLRCGAELLLTTEKDGVKLIALPNELLAKTLLCRLELTFEDPSTLAIALSNLLQK